MIADYYTSAEGVEIDYARALREFRSHDADSETPFDEWWKENESQGLVDAQALLDWLGY